MFAKLKKKIEEQGGNVADGEKFNSNANASTPLKGNYICNYMCNYICNFHIHFFFILWGLFFTAMWPSYDNKDIRFQNI